MVFLAIILNDLYKDSKQTNKTIFYYILTLQQSNIHEQTHHCIKKKIQHQCQAITSWINLLDPPNLIVEY